MRSHEAYCVSYDKANYHASINGVNCHSEVQKSREKQIRENLLQYLGEYRLGVKFAEFFYGIQTNPQTGETYLTSGDQGPIRDIYRKAIKVREEKGLSVRREVAECLGFEKLESKLLSESSGQLLIWVSPPGTSEEGYGKYSFTFIGQRVKDIDGQKKVRMVAFRNEKLIEEHKSYLSQFSEEAKNFTNDTHFLANPIFIRQTEQIKTPEDVLIKIGEKERLNADWQNEIEMKIKPLTDKYITLVRNNASDDELVKVKDAIENYVIDLKNNPRPYFVNEGPVSKEDLDKSVRYIIDYYGSYTPPKVSGSCGLSGEASASIFENLKGRNNGNNGSSAMLPMDAHNLVNKKEEEKNCQEIRCKGCGWTAKEEDVKQIQKGEMTKCPICDRSPG